MAKLLILCCCAWTLLGCQQKKKSKEPESPVPDEAKARAVVLLGKFGCLGCHTEDGSRLVGPTFKGILGRTTKLTDGREIAIDAAYLKKAIKDPAADVVDGYQAGLMPHLILTDDEVDLMVDYLKCL